MTTNPLFPLSHLSDQDVLVRVRDAVNDERCATANLIALLMEVDARRLYLGEGFSSLFTYCTQALHLSEHAAYNRIETARAARRFPLIIDMVKSGAVTLTAVRLLAPHLTDLNHRELLERVRHRTKREIELLVASIHPLPDVSSAVRKLPAPAVPRASIATTSQQDITDSNASPPIPLSIEASPSVVPAPRLSEMKPLAPERYKITVTVSRQAHDKLRRAQDLMRHSVPNGDPAIVIERALDLLVAELERTKLAVTKQPRTPRATKSGSRHIPAAIKRMVWQRDGGRCAFRGSHGRCGETGFLEYHHVVPFADGGKTSASNLELRCRAHNQYEADKWFGPAQLPMMRERRALFG